MRRLVLSAAVLLAAICWYWATTRTDRVAAPISQADPVPCAVDATRDASVAPASQVAAPSDAPALTGEAFVVTVRMPDGSPAVGATVAAYPETPTDHGSWSMGGRFYPTTKTAAPSASATTGPSGSVGLAGLAGGRWRIVADAPGAARGETSAAWAAGDPRRDVVVDLRTAHALDVTVRDRRKRAAGGAEVVVAEQSTRFGPADATRTWRATTAADGTCRVESLPEGVLEVWALTGRGQGVGSPPVRVPQVARVELELPGSGALKGRVLDPHGMGVAKASLTFHSDDNSHFSRVVARGETGADGSYDVLTSQPWATVERVDVVAAGFATLRHVQRQVRVDEGQTHVFADFAVRPEGRIEGVVTGPDGPVADADVQASVKGTGPFGEMETIASARTRADGSFSLGGLAAGKVKLSANAKGLVEEGSDDDDPVARRFRMDEDDAPESDASKVDVAEGATTKKDVRLVRTADSALICPTFVGVVRREDGTPVPWAEVWISGAARHWWIRDAGHTIAAADGTFRVTAEAAAGDFTVSAAAPGLACEYSDKLRFQVTQAETRDGIVVVVTPTPTVRGVVKSKLGLPVAGARVSAGTHHHIKFSETAYWDEQPPVFVGADGTFELHLGPKQTMGSDHDSQGDEIVVCAEAPGHAPAMSRQFTWADAAKGAVVEVELDAGADIAGRVVDEKGRGIADAPITLVKKGGRWNHGEWPPAYPPMPEETVWTRTGPRGEFRIEHVMPSAYEVEASAPGLISASVDVKAPADGVEIRLVEANEIAGVVVMAADGAPVAGAEVSLTLQGEERRDRSKRTDASGHFSFPQLPAGRWRVDVVPGHEGPDVQPATLETSAGATALRIELKKGLGISGTLVAADGRPIAGASVTGRRLDDAPTGWHHASTDDQGRFELGRLATGQFEVDVDIDDHGLEFGPFEAGQSVALRLPGDLTITGTAKLADGAQDGFMLTLRARRVGTAPGPKCVHSCEMDRSGRTFELRHLAPGQYEVESASDSTSIPAGTILVAGTRDVTLLVEEQPLEKK